MSDQKEEKLRQRLEELESTTKSNHKASAVQTTTLGRMAEQSSKLRVVYLGVLDSGCSEEKRASTVASGLDYTKALLEASESINQGQKELSGSISTSVWGFDSTLANAHLDFVMLGGVSLGEGLPVDFAGERSNLENTAHRLRSINPKLEGTYRDAIAQYHSGVHDPKRAALWQIRQTWDDLFRILAPDQEVRKSEHWHQIKGERTGLVTRSQRIDFALARYVEIGPNRDILAASKRTVLEAYGNICRAHGELDPKVVEAAFWSVEKFISQLVHSVVERDYEIL